MRKLLPYIVVIVFSFSFIIILFVSTNNKVVNSFLIYERNYNVVCSENTDNTFNVLFYVSNKKSYINDKKQIKNSFINDNEESIIEVKLINIFDNNKIINYNGIDYHEYVFSFLVLFDSADPFEWYFKNAYLQLNYNGNIEYNIQIGQFSLIKVNNNHDHITISNVKPIITEYNNNTYLSCLILGIRKVNNNIIHIKNIKLLNSNITTGSVIISNKMVNNTSFEDIFGYDFNSVNKDENDIDIVLNNNEIIYIKIPIYYEKYLPINSFPIKINYAIGDYEYNYYLYNYTFYNQTNEVISKENLHTYEIYD